MEEYDLGTGMKVITIILDEANEAPEIHLDNVPIATAMVIFQQAAQALDSYMPYPKITSGGKTISPPESLFTFEYDFDEDDDDI